MVKGPLDGIRVLEFAGIGPGPFCCMLLADLGADIIRIDRKHPGEQVVKAEKRFNVANRGRRSVALDLKNPAAIATCLELVKKADAIVEGFRPGVMEKLGLGPDVLLGANPRLVYGRMTGWGQTGPISQAAGHDINYIAISGALAAIGTREKPIPPLNLVGDYGGGSLYLAFGLVSAVFHAHRTGTGQVVDCAISDGAASLMATNYGRYASGLLTLERADNLLDGGRPAYDTYECADGKWIAIAASEAPFYKQFRDIAGFSADPEFDQRHDKQHWPSLRAKIAARFKTRTRDEWCALMEGADACFAPVLDVSEAPLHPHNRARNTFIEVEGVVQPAPAPRFSATPGAVQRPPPEAGEHNDEALGEWGISPGEIAALRASGAL